MKMTTTKAKDKIPFLHRIRPLIEAKLYAWGLMRSKFPEAPISRVYEVSSGEGGERLSQEEKWVLRFASEIKDAEVVETVMRRLSSEQKNLVQFRYKEHLGWKEIARKVGVSRRTAFNIRDGVLTVVAYECDLLKDE